MKKFIHILLLSGLMLAPAGCTLSFDDELPATNEEDTSNGDGFSAPCTRQTEYGHVTYQFEDGVRVIDEKYMPYIVFCHNDTAMHHTEILFSKNIPGDLLPQRGERLATTMSELFQTTLCDEVDYVKEAQGGYLMVSHAVPLRRVFKDLSFSVDADVAGVYEDSDTTRSCSGGRRQLKGVRLIGRNSSATRSRDVGSSSAPLFSVLLKDGDDKFSREFELKDNHGWKEDFSDLAGPLKALFPSCRIGGITNTYSTVIGIESTQNIKLDFSLREGFNLNLSNDVVQHISICSAKNDNWIAIPVVGSVGMTVPKDGILHENKWERLDYIISLLRMPGIGFDYVVVKASVDFNFGVAFDANWATRSEKLFRYESEKKATLYEWAVQTDQDYRTTFRNNNYGSIYSDPSAERAAKYLGDCMFQYASRIYFHFDVGIALGVATADITPLRFHLNVSGVHRVNSDAGSSKPSVISRQVGINKSDSMRYNATDKSLDEWKTTLSTGLSSDLQFGSYIGDLGETYDWWRQASVALMEKGLFSGTVWHTIDSAFPTMTLETTHKPNQDEYRKDYEATIKVHGNNRFGFGTDKWLQCYGELELLIFDENFNFVKSATVSDSRYKDEGHYPYISTDHEYKFHYSLQKGELPVNNRYYYAIPAFKCGKWQKTSTGATNYKFLSAQNVFAKPVKYANRINSGQINGVETLWVENDDKYCKSGYSLDGIAMDADCFFQASSPDNVHVYVEFFDTDGRCLLGKDFQYALGKNGGGKIKAIYLINHRLETVVAKARLTVWYGTVKDQTFQNPAHTKYILDEYEVVYDDDTEWWPVFDYADPSSWTSQGYRIGR